jgi:hypothetical protein
VSAFPYALAPSQMIRSVDASRDTLGRVHMKLIDIVHEVTALTEGAPYAVIGGLAQILWARKTHTDDLDVLLATGDLARAYAEVRDQRAEAWTLPDPPDRFHEQNDVFEVYHLLYQGSVVDLLSYRDAAFTAEILATAVPVPELRGIRFIRPELLLITQLLRPGAMAAIAAIELTLARRAAGRFDAAYVERWAAHVGRAEALRRTFARADELERDA